MAGRLDYGEAIKSIIRLRAGAPVWLPDAAVIPIEEARLSVGASSAGCCVYASKKAAAIIVCRPQDTRIFNPEGAPVALDGFLEQLPDLAGLLAECRKRLSR